MHGGKGLFNIFPVMMFGRWVSLRKHCWCREDLKRRAAGISLLATFRGEGFCGDPGGRLLEKLKSVLLVRSSGIGEPPHPT